MTETTIGVVGLGYVGLPLAVAFCSRYHVVGFDLDSTRIAELADGRDHTREVPEAELQAARNISFTFREADLSDCTRYVVTVPTPIDGHRNPDLGPLLEASATVGRVLKKGDIVVFESTVYPGCTEEMCVPVLEKTSGLSFNKDFFCGYSPERINPGDRTHTLAAVVKVIAGSTPDTADAVEALYASIVPAGVFRTSSIRVAEAAKVIENAQRDINIAFVNELALIFNRMGIDTKEVLAAASTKWNFLPFTPGLVGGHCIGVDPYYLTYKAETLGYHPQVILAGRRINDEMGVYVAGRVIKLMIRNGHTVSGARVLLLGITFKENCPDIRNSRAADIVKELSDYGCRVEVFDPHADGKAARDKYGIELIQHPQGIYTALILAVAHNEFENLDITKYKNDRTVVYDVKGALDPRLVTERL
ncbi:MAG TPA: nucleotide sugar dehydrogenase [Spirochaetia bacterium]|mgnify:CR=1 FL=1|nr:nucleotide sugar dehydrogenase [Spirochaetia bacterium]